MGMRESDDHKQIGAEELARAIESDPQFEAALREAADVPVPEGLAERILARHAITLRDEAQRDKVVPIDRARKGGAAPRRPLVPRWIAVAASVLLVVGLVGVNYLGRDPGTVLEQRLVVSVHETMPMYDKMVVNQEIDPNLQANLANLMQTVGLQKVGDMGEVYYCETKTISGATAGILVIPGQMGAVTAIYLMDKKVKERRSIESPTMDGVLWPEARGTVAIIGHKGEPMIGDIEQRVKSSLRWF